ncbi:carboxylate-amine ligase [Natronoarchaeum philippinense]|uniref:Glutamate--cysteine ligase n=1 Tax=Natronoarchaeum philippinense TaxID=558529 RepID=A0A285N0A4_NATPI|nr:glutamate--cysteine ligase [Natronoarchaeum philippinense]SNZ02768.1 carboxylate-amine ligase [Natronoarchaeum philippinense]
MERGSADVFDELGTLGIEEEFFVVDEDGRPTSGTDELVYDSTPPEILEGRLDHELFKFVVETQTPKIDSLDDAAATLSAVRTALVEHAAAQGFQIAAAGLHPTAKWRDLEHAEKPRYRAQLDRIQYPQHRNTTAGLHVHVGVDDADKATWIANELRWYLPPMLALSANSPYWNGFDTGLQSARAKIFEALPNTGMPTRFEDFEEYRQFEETMIESGSINDRGELWYDVRPHSGIGTVEVRTPDGQADEGRIMAFVEYVHALVMDLAARYEDGESGTEIRRELLDENKWRAIRYGQEASFVRPDGDVVDLGELVEAECERLGVSGIRELYDAESGAEKQRRLLESEGENALCESLLL